MKKETATENKCIQQNCSNCKLLKMRDETIKTMKNDYEYEKKSAKFWLEGSKYWRKEFARIRGFDTPEKEERAKKSMEKTYPIVRKLY